jgi:hypothetical protein
MVRGEDVFLWDSDGKRYIDAFAGLWNVNVGHARAELADVAATQIREVAFVPNFFILASLPPIELATRLATLFPGNLNHFQFTSGGAESNGNSGGNSCPAATALHVRLLSVWLRGSRACAWRRRWTAGGTALLATGATGRLGAPRRPD